MKTNDDERIEELARIAYDFFPHGGPPWANVPDNDRNLWRTCARAVRAAERDALRAAESTALAERDGFEAIATQTGRENARLRAALREYAPRCRVLGCTRKMTTIHDHCDAHGPRGPDDEHAAILRTLNEEPKR